MYKNNEFIDSLFVKDCCSHQACNTITAKTALSSNLLDINLKNSYLVGVDRLIGPELDLNQCTVDEIIQKINDVFSCHKHLKKKGLIGPNKKPVVQFTIEYNDIA